MESRRDFTLKRWKLDVGNLHICDFLPEGIHQSSGSSEGQKLPVYWLEVSKAKVQGWKSSYRFME